MSTPSAPPSSEETPMMLSQGQPAPQRGRSDPWLLALKQIDLKRDLSNLPNVPCSRQSLLLGIGGGVGVGAIRYLSSRRVLGSTNWAVATFALLSLTSWETCRRSRASEQAKMKQAMQDFRAKSSKSGEASPGTQGSSPAVHHHAPVGGVFVGDKGKEILQEKQHRVSQQSVMPADDSQPKRLV